MTSPILMDYHMFMIHYNLLPSHVAKRSPIDKSKNPKKHWATSMTQCLSIQRYKLWHRIPEISDSRWKVAVCSNKSRWLIIAPLEIKQQSSQKEATWELILTHKLAFTQDSKRFLDHWSRISRKSRPSNCQQNLVGPRQITCQHSQITSLRNTMLVASGMPLW